MPLTKESERIRGIIERARALLMTATQGPVKVFDEHSETGDALETVINDIDTALMHFDDDTKRYHEAQVKAAQEKAERAEKANAKKRKAAKGKKTNAAKADKGAA